MKWTFHNGFLVAAPAHDESRLIALVTYLVTCVWMMAPFTSSWHLHRSNKANRKQQDCCLRVPFLLLPFVPCNRRSKSVQTCYNDSKTQESVRRSDTVLIWRKIFVMKPHTAESQWRETERVPGIHCHFHFKRMQGDTGVCLWLRDYMWSFLPSSHYFCVFDYLWIGTANLFV